MTLAFTQDLAIELYNCKEQFPIDFDDAWIWLGYAKKQNAKDSLLEYFHEGIDFIRCGVKTSNGGRPSEHIKLTVNCLKEFGMISKTEKGKEIRQYFLECERIAKASIAKEQPKSAIELLEMQLEIAKDHDRRLTAIEDRLEIIEVDIKVLSK